ncbi:MAG: hypothetical protein GY726_03900 [Proteobacteria bacterium]|nr:hypothetical protein [Pseudomonadota bacterium]
MAERKKKAQFGALPPLYKFILNPYPSQHMSRCLFCERKSGRRKVPLLIQIKPRQMIALNYTCRYCSGCDLLIAHKHEIEHLMTEFFRHQMPESIGNDYLIIGTVEKKAWRADFEQLQPPAEISPHTHDFKLVYQELRMVLSGWYFDHEEPPATEPPASEEWVK